MKVGIYISELLHEHDTVILPGFGEFYTRYKPAKFVSEAGKIEPPSKTIAFNPDKRQGDTPLIDHLCQQQNMQAGQVSKYLADFVEEILQLLGSGKKVELEKVGVFSPGQDGTLNFEPDVSINYLEEAAGIGSVKEPPQRNSDESFPSQDIHKEKDAEESPVRSQTPFGLYNKETPKEKKDLTMEKEKKHKLPPALRWIAFTVVPLLLIIIILALNYQYFFGGSRKEQVTETTMVSPADESGGQANEPSAVVAEPEAEEVTPNQAQQTLTDPSVQPPKAETGRNVYYVVVGSFPDEAKAKQLALQLREQGASLASVFMKTGFNYYRVCYGYYYDLNEAESVLNTAKEINPDAYVLHR